MRSPMLRLLAVVLAAGGPLAAQAIGPSTTAPPYAMPSPLLPPGSVQTVSLLTAGDAVQGYRFVGVPDGMGAFLGGTVGQLVLHHELASSQGIVRAHGAAGAFVDRFTLNPATRAITSGRDHATAPSDVHRYDRGLAAWIPGAFAWERFCSGDLAASSAYSFGSLGTTNRLYLNGEEIRMPAFPRFGAAWAHVVTGPDTNKSFELPHLGQISWENAIACPFPQERTVVMATDDADQATSPTVALTPSELYVYLGNKRAIGNDIERAGLVGGTLHGMRVFAGGSLVAEESDAFALGSTSFVGSGTFDLLTFGDASTFDGVAQQLFAIANGVFRMQRIEDGAWDVRPGFENDFYFVTTASMTANSRLWRLHFNDLSQPELGGTISVVLAGNEGPRMLDNLCADVHGRLLLQEDPGGDARRARVWLYDLVNARLTEVAVANFDLFSAASPTPLTTNEECTSIVPAFDILGDGWYLMNVQVHVASPDPEIVAGGQLLALYVRPGLGRSFEAWFSSPAGPGSIALTRRFGTGSAISFAALTTFPGTFPNGAFYGVDISFADLMTQAFAGAPFLVGLDPFGIHLSATYTGFPSGLSFYGAALDDIFAAFPRVSVPFTHVVP